MMKCTTPLLSFGILFATALQAGAAEYFVHRHGSDTHDGLSRATAFSTIQKGVDALQPGDTLSIGPGEYFESVRRDRLGDATHATVVRAEIPGTVLLRGDVPAPVFIEWNGRRTTYVADYTAEVVPAVQELDTLKILTHVPNPAEVEFSPGAFHYDRAARKLYLSTTDGKSLGLHRYSISTTPTHGLLLVDPVRVTIEGLAVTGFNAFGEQDKEEGTHGSVWGMFLVNGKNCLIRNCQAYLNGRGIGMQSSVNNAKIDAGGNVIDGCTAWANASPYQVDDSGGLTLLFPSRDVIRNSRSYRNGNYGINIYGGPAANADERHQSRLTNNLAWGNALQDFKVKTGFADGINVVEGNVGLGAWGTRRMERCLLGVYNRGSAEYGRGNIALADEPAADSQSEFADPENHDFRLQAASQFRRMAPDGGDRGPFPYEANVFYVRTDGDDGSDGLSMATAWRTIARGVKELRPGDTLYLAPGCYAESVAFSAEGTAQAPISLRGRGRDPVVISGSVRIDGGRHLHVARLNFGGEVVAIDGGDVAFEQCRFTAPGIGLVARGTTGLSAAHCEFTRFEQAAISLTDCARVDLRGNLYDNRRGVAAMIDRPGAVRYSDYNAYCNAATAWQLGGETRTLIDLQEIADAYSRESIPEFATVDEVSVLLNPGPFAAAGPLGRPIGIYRDEPDRREFRLLHGPTVYSVGATSANLEWMTSLPAVCEIAWGETPECTNVKKFEVNYFGSYGLTGLQPGRTYYFRVNSLKTPLVKNEDEQARPDPVELSAPAISFTTLAENPAPRTYYVALDGDDSAAGRDRREAWRSLRHAATQVRPGDTVFVAGGTYQERVQLRVTGEPDAPITFRCMPGEKVVMDGAKQTIKGAFLATGKSHLRFDGFYFRDFNFLNRGWKLGLSAEFLLYDGRDIQITRCFSDGRTGMYTARFLIAERIEDLLIKNCVTIDKMSAQMVLTNCPNLHIEHTVFARPKTANLHLFNEEEHPAVIEKCIFTDMLKKKSDSNIPMFLIYQRSGFQMQNVCFMLRSFPPEERLLVPGLGDDRKRIKVKDVEREAAFMNEPLYANPRFAGDPSVPGEFGPDKMMRRDLPLDFDSFFATNPDAVARGIGLVPQDFQDFRFEKK